MLRWCWARANHFNFVFDQNKAMRKFGIDEGGRVQKFIDSECLKYSTEFAPFDQHTLIESAKLNTQIGSGEVRYRTPYARRLYYHPEYNFSQEKNSKAGAYWFENMKAQYKDQILKGAQAIANQGG